MAKKMKGWMVLGALLAGCGSNAAVTPPASPTPDIPALARQYQAIADKGNAAQDALRVRLSAATTAAESSAVYLALADVEHQFTNDFAKLQVPATMQADAHDLIKALSVFEQVLRSIGAAKSTLEQATLISEFTKDKADVGAATDIVRRDLGLPAATK